MISTRNTCRIVAWMQTCFHSQFASMILSSVCAAVTQVQPTESECWSVVTVSQCSDSLPGSQTRWAAMLPQHYLMYLAIPYYYVLFLNTISTTGMISLTVIWCKIIGLKLCKIAHYIVWCD